MESFDINTRNEILKGDFRNEAEDSYIRILEQGSKKNRLVRIGMVTTYSILIILSLLVV